MDSATKILLDGFAPDSTSLIEVHLRSVASFQAIDGFGKLFSEPLVFDVLDGVQVGLECED
jgi:hypothetical protein